MDYSCGRAVTSDDGTLLSGPCMSNLLHIPNHTAYLNTERMPGIKENSRFTKEEQLLEAIKIGEDHQAENLLRQGVDINTPDDEGLSPLHLAVAAGGDYRESPEVSRRRIELVRKLLDAGAKVNQKGWEGWTPLHEAACNRNPEFAKLLLHHEAKLDALDEWGQSPLYLAVVLGTPQVARVLVDAKADIMTCYKPQETRLRDADGETPLHAAVHRGSAEVVEMLLQAGAAANAKNNWGCTPLHYAAERMGQRRYRKDMDIMNQLIKAGANLEARDIHGRTPKDIVRDLGEFVLIEEYC